MKFENTKVYNIEGAFRGMRNPLSSWEKSDSCFENMSNPSIGKKDLELAQRLISGGSEHRKFLRQIFVCVDITAPAYFMAELDTYKIGVTRNSTSFMHTGVKRPFTINDFEIDDDIVTKFLSFEEKDKSLYDDMDYEEKAQCLMWEHIIANLNSLRDKYLQTKDYKYFRIIRQMLPNGYLYKSTFTMSYENIYNICHQRENHRLIEWHKFIEWAGTLPYADKLIFI